jgi:predicted transposase/invertase (TIGR01784 family)
MLNDYVFKKVMGEKGDETQLQAFLEAVLGKTLKNVEIVGDKELSAEIIGDKLSILDVRAKIDDNTDANIEVQLRNEYNMDRRSLFHWSRLYGKSLGESQNYSGLPNVVTINILRYNFFKEKKRTKKYHSIYRLYEEETKEKLTDALEIHFLEMRKFMKLKDKDIANNKMHRWLTFLNQSTNEEIVKEVSAMDTAINQANKKYEYVLSDKEALHQAMLRERAIIGYNSNIADAEERGEKRERKRSEQEKLETAYEMFADGENITKIRKYSRLPDEELAKILGKLPEEIRIKYIGCF